jgi:hypothetical protein
MLTSSMMLRACPQVADLEVADAVSRPVGADLYI